LSSFFVGSAPRVFAQLVQQNVQRSDRTYPFAVQIGPPIDHFPTTSGGIKQPHGSNSNEHYDLPAFRAAQEITQR